VTSSLSNHNCLACRTKKHSQWSWA